MSLSDEQFKTLIHLLLEKSTRNMEQAEANARLNYWDLVANRLYYSLFHAVTALMQTDGLKLGTHKGTSAQFGKNYVLTGIFDRNDGILYSRLQTMREKADYQNTFTLDEEAGMKLLEDAKQLRDKIYNLIQTKL
ncbi:MAG: HEPN domain-containing protein [Muribaculaceae bacterium]|nr:HEPN domain-containing protein [Muribaculaceae bacterium]MDE6295413.1 HEPN domain-containing protein [Muribaculaceae bacterium]